MSVNPYNQSTSTNICKAEIVTPSTTPARDTIVKVPVLLQEFSIQVPMHAKITFPENEEVLEIKQIKKRVYTTQCRLIQPHGNTCSGNLFLSGFVRKNIQYAANPVQDCEKEILSTIRSLTVDVPFDCVVQIESFLRPPVGPFLDSRDEFGYLVSKPLGKGYPEKDRMMSTDLSQYHQISTEHYNEMPYCDLIKADITEFDESLDRVPFTKKIPNEEVCRITKCTKCHKKKCLWCMGEDDRKRCSKCNKRKRRKCENCTQCTCKKCHHSPVLTEGVFTELSEKMILDLTLKLLQKQQVKLS